MRSKTLLSTRRTQIAAVLAVTLSTTASLFSQSLIPIGVLNSVTPYSVVQAVSEDGRYAVGTSTGAGGTVRVPIVWSMTDGLVALPNPSGANSVAHGVAVGIGANAGSILISGLHEGNLTHRVYRAPLAGLASGTWADTATLGGIGSVGNVRGGTANVLRNDYGVGDGRWYTAGRRNDTGRNARLRGNANGTYTGWDGTAVSSVGSVSGYGVNVGRSTTPTGGYSSAFYEGPGLVYGTVPGSAGFRVDGIGISTFFGKSTDNDSQWIVGQANNYNGPNTAMQAFRWKRGDASMTFLGSLAPAGGGDIGNNSSVAYSVANNGVAGGHSYFGASGGGTVAAYYDATIWDTSGTWDTTGAPKSLMSLLSSQGVDTSMWSQLQRVYAVSDDGKVLGGYGIWAADGTTRGFIAMIPEPGSLSFVVLGVAALVLRRKNAA